MQRILFIGSTVADVIVRVPLLPRTGQDIHVISQSTSLGGCCYNAYHASQLVGGKGVLFSPTGSGVWGDWIRNELQKQGTVPMAPQVLTPSGCCYCFVQPDGERTFASHHGAEYLFEGEWFHVLENEKFDSVYVCGLQIEEKTGMCMIEWLEKNPQKTIYFAPGPRLVRIEKEKMTRLMALHPVLHLNESEAKEYTQAPDAASAARAIHQITQNDVIITLGARGAMWYHNGEVITAPGVKADVVDTIGAGDSHIGAIMALMASGSTRLEALQGANRMSSAVVSHSGARISQDEWVHWQQEHASAEG